MGAQAQKRGRHSLMREGASQLHRETGISYTEAQGAKKSAAIKRFLGVLEQGWSISEGARQAGVSRRTLYTWRDEDPEFARAWDDAYGEGGSDFYEDKLRDRVLKGDTVALIVRLKQRGRFIERPTVGEDVALAAGAVLAMLRQAAQRELPPAEDVETQGRVITGGEEAGAAQGIVEGEAGDSLEAEAEGDQPASAASPSEVSPQLREQYDRYFPRA